MDPNGWLGPTGPFAKASPPGGAPGGTSGASGAAGAYDTSSLVAALRPSLRADAARIAGVSSLSDLPLYDLSVSLDYDKATFSLEEEVYFRNGEPRPLEDVVLRVYANAAEGGARSPGAPALVSFKSGSCVGAPCDVKADSETAITIRPEHALAPGERLRIKLAFDGRLDVIDASRTNMLAQSLESMSMLSGAESQSFGLLAKGDDIVSLANFYAVVARRRDGAWERADDSTMGDLGSDDLSNVHARIDVPESVHAATSGVARKDEVRAGRREIEVDAGLVRDFAIIASDKLETATADVGGVTVRSHFLPSERKAGERVLDTAVFALANFEKRFGPYPYADFDVCEAALIGGAGGVEFAGLVTVASMFYRPALPSDGMLGPMLGALLDGAGKNPLEELTASMLEFTTAHEVAHQFWHGLVGSDSRVHPYLDESLAQFSAVQYMHDRYGDARAKKEAGMNVAMGYKTMRMLGKPDGSVDRPVSAFGDMVSYAGIVYGKAPYLWLALRDELGEADFFEGVRRYVEANRLRIAMPGALVEALVKQSPAKEARIRELARHWLEESHGDEDIGAGSLLDMLGPSMGLDPAAMDPKLKSLMDKAMKGGGPGDLDIDDLMSLLGPT